MTIAIPVLAVLIGFCGLGAHAGDWEPTGRFEEQSIEFHNHDVKLAGSLLLPRSQGPVPAVVFVHGAGRHTRKSCLEVGEYFASRGIAALIYDKRGAGQSGGAYESHEPYANLVDDALAGVEFLRRQREISESRIGIWGLSQGAYISAAAAARSRDIKFIVAVGASVADGTMFYYRDNLFRKYQLSPTLRDLAEKAHLAQWSLPHNRHDDSLLTYLKPRSYPSPNEYVHPAWRHVSQPVLAMWGQLDQNVPVGESVAGLKNSLAQAQNENWTIIVLPQANHSLGISETGALQSKWGGYYPGALKRMADWVWTVIDHPSEIDQLKQEGVPREAAILSKLARYERLRWYGNGTLQSALWILFFATFLTNTISGIRCCYTRLFRQQQRVGLQSSNRAETVTRAIGSLNLGILISFSVIVMLVLDQLHPSCPWILRFVPILGTISTLGTFALTIIVARTSRVDGRIASTRTRLTLDVLCFVLFVPYMYYWNLVGFRL